MHLAIDVGNTNAVVGLCEGTSIVRSWRISTQNPTTSDELRAKIDWFLATLDEPLAKSALAVVVSSVVPRWDGILKQAFPDRVVHFITSRSPFSFSIEASPAHAVGADRLVNAEAALREYGAPAIVVDSGTATTLCALSRDRKYLGGAILPGIELSMAALARNAAKLFSVELEAPPQAIAGNTEDAIRSGVLYGYASMIDGLVERFRKELGEPDARVVATGGVIPLIRKHARAIDTYDPDLTLKGIGWIYGSIRDL